MRIAGQALQLETDDEPKATPLQKGDVFFIGREGPFVIRNAEVSSALSNEWERVLDNGPVHMRQCDRR